MSGTDVRLFEKAISYKKEGNELFKIEKFELAIKKYSRALYLCPHSNLKEKVELYHNRAVCHEALEDWENVVKDCTKAIKLCCNCESALKRRCRAFERLGKLNNAVDDMALLCVFGAPKNEGYFCEYERLLREYSEYEGSLQYMINNEVAVSNQAIRSHFSMFSKNGFIVGEVDKKSLAAKLCELKYKENDLNGIHKINAIKGTIEYLKMNYFVAEQYFEEIVDFHGDKDTRVYALIMLALCSFNEMLTGLRDTTMVQKIWQHFEDALRIDENNGDIYFHRAPFVDYISHQNYDLTIKQLEKCASLSPNNFAAKAKLLYCRLLKSHSLGNENEVGKTIEEFRQNLKVNPNSTQYLIYYTFAMLNTYKEDKLKDCLSFALKSTSEDNDLRLCKALLLFYTDKQNVNTSIKLLTDAVEADEQCQFGHEMLALLNTSTHDFKKAMHHIDEALKSVRTEQHCISLFRFKAVINSQLFVNKFVKRNQKDTAITFSKTPKFSEFFEAIVGNWFMKLIYNGFSIICCAESF